jgi:uncharacterized protein (DUF2062 family)
MVGRFLKNLKHAIITMLKSGMGPKKISLCIALGIVLGIFPVLGITTILCAAVSVALRLNVAAMQIVNYMVYPIQIILLAPFYSAGFWLFNERSELVGIGNILLMMKNDFWGSLAGLWDQTLYAIIVWSVICPILVLILYNLIRPAVTAILHKKAQ